MPIFEYKCESCGHKFEAILFGEQTAECPKCHTEKLEQQLSTFAVGTRGFVVAPGHRLRAVELLHDEWRLRTELGPLAQ